MWRVRLGPVKSDFRLCLIEYRHKTRLSPHYDYTIICSPSDFWTVLSRQYCVHEKAGIFRGAGTRKRLMITSTDRRRINAGSSLIRHQTSMMTNRSRSKSCCDLWTLTVENCNECPADSFDCDSRPFSDRAAVAPNSRYGVPTWMGCVLPDQCSKTLTRDAITQARWHGFTKPLGTDSCPER